MRPELGVSNAQKDAMAHLFSAGQFPVEELVTVVRKLKGGMTPSWVREALPRTWFDSPVEPIERNRRRISLLRPRLSPSRRRFFSLTPFVVSVVLLGGN